MAEGGGLLNRYTGLTRIVGSNPIPSANSLAQTDAMVASATLFLARSKSFAAIAFSAETRHPWQPQVKEDPSSQQTAVRCVKTFLERVWLWLIAARGSCNGVSLGVLCASLCWDVVSRRTSPVRLRAVRRGGGSARCRAEGQVGAGASDAARAHPLPASAAFEGSEAALNEGAGRCARAVRPALPGGERAASMGARHDAVGDARLGQRGTAVCAAQGLRPKGTRLAVEG